MTKTTWKPLTTEHQSKKRLTASVCKLKEQYSDSSKDCTSEKEIDSGECLPFVRINQLRRPLNNGKDFSKISKSIEQSGSYHLQFEFQLLPFGWRETGNWKV